MGHRYAVRCRRCGAEFMAQEGGGFFFHLLHCDRCGSEKGIRFRDLGEIHPKFLKGLGMPYCGVTRHYDLWIQENYPGEPITEEEYYRAFETFAGSAIVVATIEWMQKRDARNATRRILKPAGFWAIMTDEELQEKRAWGF